MLVFLLPAMRQAEAGTDISIDFFYDNLGSDGSWVEVADYGYCWQPSIAVSNSSWRPYADGYWAYTDVGWTWVSYEDFGWATYHYGRWTRLRDRGWFWVPGRAWGPAWVSWRTGGDYVGWAPLPPRGGGEDYDDRPINGQVDVEFDIGPASYNFVDVRYIGEPVLRERIFEANLNITYVSATVNVTNISYTNSTVYNYGPDYNTLSRYSTRPIRRMTLEHDANVDLSVAARSNGLTRVQGDKLIIAAPPRLQKPPKPIAPKMVKEKIAKPTFEHGWSDVSDPRAQAELKRKMKGENPKNIPPSSIKPREDGETAPTQAVSANPADTSAPAAPASPALSPPGKHKNERDEKLAPVVSPSSSTAPGTSPAPTRNNPSDHRQRISSPLTTSPDGTPYREPPIHDKGVKKNKRSEEAPEIAPVAPRQPNDVLIEKAPRTPQEEPIVAPPFITPKRPLPPERVAPWNREAPPVSTPKRPLPSERVAPPNREASPEVQRMRPLPPERVAPPNREAPPVIMPKHALPPERVVPQNREAPPEVPRMRPLPPERVAPPPGPGANGPVKAEAPPNKRGPDKRTNEPSPPPGS